MIGPARRPLRTACGSPATGTVPTGRPGIANGGTDHGSGVTAAVTDAAGACSGADPSLSSTAVSDDAVGGRRRDDRVPTDGRRSWRATGRSGCTEWGCCPCRRPALLVPVVSVAEGVGVRVPTRGSWRGWRVTGRSGCTEWGRCRCQPAPSGTGAVDGRRHGDHGCRRADKGGSARDWSEWRCGVGSLSCRQSALSLPVWSVAEGSVTGYRHAADGGAGGCVARVVVLVGSPRRRYRCGR